jgi:hypothetical protein
MTAGPLVTTLRARAGTICLAREGEPTIAIRAQLADAWDAVRIEVSEAAPVAVVKACALEAFGAGGGRAGDYVVTLGGVEVRDESATLASVGVVNGSTLFIAFSRRRPVR